MARISKAQGAEHRTRLLAAAERLFRERGYEEVNLSEIARAAGLTHGAFYTHFASKEALFAEACEHALATSAEEIRSGRHVRRLREFVDRYLKPAAIERRPTGCAMAALGDDAARGPIEVRAAFARGLDEMFEAVGSLDADVSAEQRRRATIATTAQLVGALVLARSVADTALAEEILAAVHDTLAPGRPADGGAN